MIESTFEYDTDGLVLWIKDMDLGGKSVTNDMENVLQRIIDEGTNIYNYRIMYRDSSGTWDGVTVSKTVKRIKFSFFAISEKDYDRAKSKLLSLTKL
jgi:hypothetical protein